MIKYLVHQGLIRDLLLIKANFTSAKIQEACVSGVRSCRKEQAYMIFVISLNVMWPPHKLASNRKLIEQY